MVLDNSRHGCLVNAFSRMSWFQGTWQRTGSTSWQATKEWEVRKTQDKIPASTFPSDLLPLGRADSPKDSTYPPPPPPPPQPPPPPKNGTTNWRTKCPIHKSVVCISHLWRFLSKGSLTEMHMPRSWVGLIVESFCWTHEPWSHGKHRH